MTATLDSLRSVKLPVRDLAASLDWYRRVFALEPFLEFPDEEGVVRGVAGRLPGCGGAGLALRHQPESHAVPGLEVMLGVADRDALLSWCRHLDELGVAHSPVVEATIGWLVVLHDPDGHEFHLYSGADHGLDVSGRPGYGRAPTTGI